MWFKNKQTGLNWEIVDNETIKRLSIDENYEIVKVEEEKPVKPKAKSTNKKKSAKK